MSANLTDGRASAWVCRRLDGMNPGHHAVMVVVYDFKIELIYAVVDDFGNLVSVDK